MNKNITLPMALVAIVIALAGGFFGGMKYQQNKNRAFVGGMMGAGNFQGRVGGQGNNRFGGAGGSRMGFRPVAGEIIAVDDTSITVKMDDGSSKIVMMSDKTTINKADEGTKTDLKTGTKVAVFGSENTDGTVTAQSIQLNPMLRMMGAPSGTPSASSAPKAQ